MVAQDKNKFKSAGAEKVHLSSSEQREGKGKRYPSATPTFAAGRRAERRYQQERAESIRACCERLTAQEAELRRRFEAGELRMVVEWWEEDDLYIDENAHLLFLFTDDTAWEIDLYPQVQEQLKPLLASFGIAWEPVINFHFDSRILYPPPYAEQKYYNPDGSVRKEFL